MAKYDLVGVDGNAFAIMGYVVGAMRKEHFTKEEIKDYQKRAMASDYDNLLRVSVEQIDMVNNRGE